MKKANNAYCTKNTIGQIMQQGIQIAPRCPEYPNGLALFFVSSRTGGPARPEHRKAGRSTDR
jgi:hypothetical protein